MTRIKSVPVLLFLALAFACDAGSPEPELKNPEEIARDVSRDVGSVGRTGQGTQGAPIIILEERHESRVGQVEHAVALVRLHEKYGLRDVGLEGYLKEDPPMRPDDLGGLSPRSDPRARARVAARLIETGEVGCSEFLKLVYSDVSLHPVERREDRGALATDETANIARVYLAAIAVNSMTEDERSTAAKLGRLGEREAATYILSSDDWTRSKHEVLSSDPSVEEEFETVKEISGRADSLGLEMKRGERAAMEAHLDFLRRRVNASEVMARAAAEMADRPGVKVVALNIGVGHTKAVSERLQAGGRPFAVITPSSMSSATGTFKGEEMRLKYQGMPPDPKEGVNRLLSESIPRLNPGRLKPPSRLALRDALLRARAEFLDITARVTDAVLPAGDRPPEPPDVAPAPTPGGPQGSPLLVGTPEAFHAGSADEYQGEFVSVDRTQVFTLKIPGTNRLAVLIPITLDPRGPSPTQVWIIADREEGLAGGLEAVEAILLKILQKVKMGQPEVTRLIGKARLVQISVDIRAIMAPTKDEAMRAMSRY